MVQRVEQVLGGVKMVVRGTVEVGPEGNMGDRDGVTASAEVILKFGLKERVPNVA